MNSNQIGRFIEMFLRRKGSRAWAIGLIVAIGAEPFMKLILVGESVLLAGRLVSERSARRRDMFDLYWMKIESSPRSHLFRSFDL